MCYPCVRIFSSSLNLFSFGMLLEQKKHSDDVLLDLWKSTTYITYTSKMSEILLIKHELKKNVQQNCIFEPILISKRQCEDECNVSYLHAA